MFGAGLESTVLSLCPVQWSCRNRSCKYYPLLLHERGGSTAAHAWLEWFLGCRSTIRFSSLGSWMKISSAGPPTWQSIRLENIFSVFPGNTNSPTLVAHSDSFYFLCQQLSIYHFKLFIRSDILQGLASNLL